MWKSMISVVALVGAVSTAAWADETNGDRVRPEPQRTGNGAGVLKETGEAVGGALDATGNAVAKGTQAAGDAVGDVAESGTTKIDRDKKPD
ncbi:hypothetical protein [Acuticoccus sp. I52.16.1]|uniref:hypothetical protein n=1 Tax=Acuticoccus sp. I52.16.1 TaxID=2928472 RepID=UPI001FD61BB2|nr:hypothetical protein [Acuticoccus sp. I52.16.1]UOM36026.1 hypothetical protein MRB58_07470 [Acuticoccus sp. I52.16.1]